MKISAVDKVNFSTIFISNQFFTETSSDTLQGKKDQISEFRNTRKDQEEESATYCEFCGELIENNPRGSRSKYCSKKHQQTAARRRMARRLDIPAKVDRFDPLYFS
jgi:hypothetical protein